MERKRNRTGRTILISLLLLFIAAQFVQPPHNNGVATGPEDITQVVMVPPDVMGLLIRSCYDCHSDYTKYPWYDYIFPVNWWITNHINDGKHELNFTHFAKYSAKKQSKKLEESAEQVEKHEMPLKSYLITHTEAKLTDAERQILIQWAKSAAGGEQNKAEQSEPKP